VRAALVLKQQEIRGCARLVQDLPEVPLVMAREKHLVQVFVNLLENAMHALPPERPEANEISVRSFLAPQRRVVVEVADTGTGILPEVRARMFDPFFTTKEIGKGMGLGLFMCHGIVAALGGEMDVDSEPGRGTSIRVILPAASAQA
jgi:signal transduction histidine kinase